MGAKLVSARKDCGKMEGWRGLSFTVAENTSNQQLCGASRLKELDCRSYLTDCSLGWKSFATFKGDSFTSSFTMAPLPWYRLTTGPVPEMLMCPNF